MKKIFLFLVYIFTFFIFSSSPTIGANPCSDLGYECGSVYSKGDKQSYDCGSCTPATTKICDVVTHKCVDLNTSCGTCQSKGYTCGDYKNSCNVTQNCGDCSGTDYCSNRSGGTCMRSTTSDGTGTGTDGIGPWGAPGSGPSLGDVSKLLGVGAPANASKAGFNSIIGLVLSLLILAAIILSLLFLIWGGFDWITSGGDKQKLQSARHKIVFAIIGLIIVFLAFFVVNVVSNLFGLGGGGSGALPQPPNEHIGGK